MTEDIKLVVSCSIAPVIADFLEDCPLRFEAKMRANRLINEIRSFDEFIMKGTNIEQINQQIDIQMAFRQWVKENFK